MPKKNVRFIGLLSAATALHGDAQTKQECILEWNLIECPSRSPTVLYLLYIAQQVVLMLSLSASAKVESRVRDLLPRWKKLRS